MASESSQNEVPSSDDETVDFGPASLCAVIMLIKQFNRQLLERQQAKAMRPVPKVKKFSIVHNLIASEVHGKPRSQLLKTKKLQHIICSAHVKKEFRNVKPLRIKDDTFIRRRNPRNVLEETLIKMKFFLNLKRLQTSVLREIYSYPSRRILNSGRVFRRPRGCLNILSPANSSIKKCIDTLVSEELVRFKCELFKFSIWDECRASFEKNLDLKIKMMKAMQNDDYNGDNGADKLSLRNHHVIPFL